jgi:hypothetical protein
MIYYDQWLSSKTNLQTQQHEASAARLYEALKPVRRVLGWITQCALNGAAQDKTSAPPSIAPSSSSGAKANWAYEVIPMRAVDLKVDDASSVINKDNDEHLPLAAA